MPTLPGETRDARQAQSTPKADILDKLLILQRNQWLPVFFAGHFREDLARQIKRATQIRDAYFKTEDRGSNNPLTGKPVANLLVAALPAQSKQAW